MKQEHTKVFGIGLSKTGTSSLAYALELLEYKVKDCLGVEEYRKGDITSIDETVLANHNALTDTPIPSFYRELDAQYPDSKFILTVRNIDGWLKSCKKQFNQKSAAKQSEAHNQLFTDLYGTDIFEENKFKQGYLDFVDGVMTYFKDRPNDLLVLNITDGEGWEKLCPFLNKPVPAQPFPKSNVTQIRWLNIHQLAQSIRNCSLPINQLSEDLSIRHDTNANKLKSALFSLLGIKVSDRINKSTMRIQKHIEHELHNLAPEIPCVTKHNHDVPFTSRSSWNHFWLISCSEGPQLTHDGAVGHSINIALIEDRRPYLGIIYIPAIDSIYYAAINKGAYKRYGNTEPAKISVDPDFPLLSSQTTSSEDNIGGIICQQLESMAPLHLSISDSHEWQTAAAQAILKTLDISMIDENSKLELKYNKENWNNAPIIIKPVQN